VIALHDGLEFDIASIRGEAIRDEADYQGVRIHLTARLAKAQIPFHVDMNFGDPIWPVPQPTKVPRLLGGDIEIPAYPLTMVLAEKIVTAVERGPANTRWRDFVDIAAIVATTEVPAGELDGSITAVADHRGVTAAPLAATLENMAATAQPKWMAWRRKQHLETATPQAFQDLVDACTHFADPVLNRSAAGLRWFPEDRAWR
jgi:hypothetical protein